MRRLSLLLVLVVVLVACGGPLADDAPGEVIFSQTCAACHGNELQGRSGPRLGGPEAASADQPREYFINTVTRGRSRMPSFSAILTETQIERVVDYVMSRQGR